MIPGIFRIPLAMLHHPVGRITRIMVTVADISQRMNCKGPRPPSSPNPPWYHPNSTTGSFVGSSSAKASRPNPGPDSQVLRSTSRRRTQQRGVYSSLLNWKIGHNPQQTGVTQSRSDTEIQYHFLQDTWQVRRACNRAGNLLILSSVDPAIGMEIRHLEWLHNGARIAFIAPSGAGRHPYSVLWAKCCTS